ncbi:MAG TPA: DUF202 domain-containing protein [Allosphingosinicella sp.]|jgi:putative membrane protein
MRSRSPDDLRPPIDTSLELAAERTVLALERTYSAWVRTGLAAIGAAVGLHAVLESRVPKLLLHVSGTALILFGLLCFIAGTSRSRVSARVVLDSRDAIRPLLIAIMDALLFLGALAAIVSLWID